MKRHLMQMLIGTSVLVGGLISDVGAGAATIRGGHGGYRGGYGGYRGGYGGYRGGYGGYVVGGQPIYQPQRYYIPAGYEGYPPGTVVNYGGILYVIGNNGFMYLQ